MSKEGKEKNKGGRPTKMTPRLLELFTDIVNESNNVVAWTNEDIFDELNHRLKLEKLEGISYSTFCKWKGNPQTLELHDQFLHVIKEALRKQKRALLTSLSTDDKAWTRWAWIIERKFAEWNLKNINENKDDVTVKGLPNFLLKGGDKSK